MFIQLNVSSMPMRDCKNCELNMRGMLIGRLNVRPYKARKGMARRGQGLLHCAPALRARGRGLRAVTLWRQRCAQWAKGTGR